MEYCHVNIFLQREINGLSMYLPQSCEAGLGERQDGKNLTSPNPVHFSGFL